MTDSVLTERSARVVAYAKLRRAAVRRREGRFLAEGANAVDAALRSGAARSVLVDVTEESRHHQLVDLAHQLAVPVLLLTDRAVGKLSDTTSPPGVLAECDLLDRPLPDLVTARPHRVIVPVEMNEPGNAGTLIRTADAFGADAVVLAGDSVDPHNGKCVRASAGSVFHVPIARADVGDTIDTLRAAGLTLLATSGAGEISLAEASPLLAGRVAWLFGNEAHGLSDELMATADHRIRIPIAGRAESLNLAAAAAICMYATAQAAADPTPPQARR